MISLLEAVILSFVQGIAEWFPISSSGHLAILHNIFGAQNLAYDVFLHLAGVLAVIVIFRRELKNLLDFRKKENLRYILFIGIAIIPAALVGIFFEDYIKSFFSSLFYLGCFFIFSGFVIFLTKFANSKRSSVTLSDSVVIGLFQAVAVLPGVSRSGATISAGLFRGLEKKSAVAFSFLLSIPIILGAGVLESGDLLFSEIDFSILITSFIITFLVSILSIKILLRILNSDKFYWFGIYNFVLGIAVLSRYLLS